MYEYSNYNKYNQNYQKQNKNIQLNKYFNKVQFDQDYTDVLNAITLLTQNSKGFVIPDVTTKSCKNPQDIQKDVDIFVNKLNDAIYSGKICTKTSLNNKYDGWQQAMKDIGMPTLYDQPSG